MIQIQKNIIYCSLLILLFFLFQSTTFGQIKINSYDLLSDDSIQCNALVTNEFSFLKKELLSLKNGLNHKFSLNDENEIIYLRKDVGTSHTHNIDITYVIRFNEKEVEYIKITTRDYKTAQQQFKFLNDSLFNIEDVKKICYFQYMNLKNIFSKTFLSVKIKNTEKITIYTLNAGIRCKDDDIKYPSTEVEKIVDNIRFNLEE